MGKRSAQEVWEAALGELQIQVSKPNYRTWLEKTVGVSYQDNQFVVSAPSPFVAEYLDKNQRSLIEKTLINVTSAPDIKVVFQVDGRYKNYSGTHGAGVKNSPPAQTYSSSLKSDYVFDSFVVGNCNQLAYAAALGVAQSPGTTYNPLFIYGGVGLGKTHLLHAIGHAAMASNIQVLCVSAEQFTNEFVSAVRDRKTDEFRNKYRNIGMLLVDDVHFIGGKEQTEESFFHTFNELHNHNRQIVITSDLSPKAMPLLEERLRSRFEWGLIVDIQPPGYETRLAILQAKARLTGVTIAPGTLEFIAQKNHQNIRELEGSLNRVVAYARLFRASPTMDLASRALENIANKGPAATSPTPGLVLEAVAEGFELAAADLKGYKRDKETNLARRVAMYLIRQETNCSLAQIGEELGGRDPSSVTNACKKIASDINTDHYLQRKITDIQKKLNSTAKVYN